MPNTTEQIKLPRRSRRPPVYRDAGLDLDSLDPDADGLTILQHLVNSPNDPDRHDSLFAEEVVAVEKLFSSGQISVEAAAERLGLTVQEFFEEFVFDESSAPEITEKERQMLSITAAESLQEVHVGRTIRAFIRETVLSDEQLAIAELMLGDEVGKRLRKAVENLPDKLLGIVLRQARSVGYSLPEFVKIYIFNREWSVAAGIDGVALSELIERTIAALKVAHEYLLNDYSFSALQVEKKEISDRNVDRLAYAIARRRIGVAKELVVRFDNRPSLVSPSQRNGAVLLNLYAQWIDFDNRYLSRVEDALAEFRHQPAGSRTALEEANLDMAEGLVHLHNEKYKKAIVNLRYSVKSALKIGDRDTAAMGFYFLSRAYWKRSLYAKALRFAGWAKRRNKNLARPEREAAIEILEGWLLLLLCNREEARARLEKARKVIARTDDYGSHGNALSFSGRLYMDEGQYEKALELFEDALWAYQKADARHRNIPRTYFNMANVCFLDARKLSSDPECRARVLDRRLEAFEYLEIAEEIYHLDPSRNHRGLGKVHNLRGLLYAASGEFSNAKKEIERAYFFGRQTKDHLVMGKARKNQWSILTDERGGSARQTDGQPSNEAILALASAEEGLRHALKTNNKRLQARCCLFLGHSLLVLNRDHEGAESYLESARFCLDAGPWQQNSTEPNPSQQTYWDKKLKALQEAIENCRKEIGAPKTELTC